MTPRRIGGVALIVVGLALVVVATALIVLAYNLSHGGFGSAWPEPAYLPAVGGAVGLGLVVTGIVMLRPRRAA